MISVWWLIVEAIGFIWLIASFRRATRMVALGDALENPDGAREELAKNWKVEVKSLFFRYRAILPEHIRHN